MVVVVVVVIHLLKLDMMLQNELRNVYLSNTREQQPSVLHRLKFSVFTNFILLCNYCYLRLF